MLPKDMPGSHLFPVNKFSNLIRFKQIFHFGMLLKENAF